MVDICQQYEPAKLIAERERTLLHLDHLREALKYEVGPIIDRKDPCLKEHEMVLTQIQILECELQWLEEALRRADQGTYGLCSHCGQPIDPARLEVLPEATLCFECKTSLERQQRFRAVS